MAHFRFFDAQESMIEITGDPVLGNTLLTGYTFFECDAVDLDEALTLFNAAVGYSMDKAQLHT